MQVGNRNGYNFHKNFEVTSACGFNMTSSMGPPPFPHTCRTASETGEQFSMPILSVLSCPGTAGNLFLYGNCT